VDIRIQCLCIDSAHPSKSADFWEAALGWRRTYDTDRQVVLEGLGARRVDVGQGDVGWVVLADPDGNEFCVLKPLRPESESAS